MTISVIIPTFNRPVSLRRTLEALSRSTFPVDEFEVIVVDDGGSESLEDIVAEARTAITVRMVRQANGGPASARNNGARLARGHILAFTDDDCEPAADWLSVLAREFRKRGDRMVGGSVTNALRGNIYAEASQTIADFCLSFLNKNPENGRFFPSNNFAVCCRLFRRVGEFDAGIPLCGGEDRDFCDRWRSNGLKLSWAKDAVIHHSHEMGLRGFWRQHFVYGRGAYLFGMARRRRECGPVPWEGWGFHLGLIGAAIATGRRDRVLRISALLLMSQAAVLTGFCRQRLSTEPGGWALRATRQSVRD